MYNVIDLSDFIDHRNNLKFRSLNKDDAVELGHKKHFMPASERKIYYQRLASKAGYSGKKAFRVKEIGEKVYIVRIA